MNLADVLFVLLIIYFSVALFTRLYEWLEHRTRKKKLIDMLKNLKEIVEKYSEEDDES